MRQVTHALLTRPPLSHQTLHPEGIEVRCFVRLACVKHAASVHPEPGSNSQKKFILSEQKAWLFFFRNSFTIVMGASFQMLFDFFCFTTRRRIYSLNFQGCFTVQLSMFFAFKFLFRSQRRVISYHSFLYLSTSFFFFFTFLFSNRVGGNSLIEFPSSHTTTQAVRHVAVQ